MYAIYFAVENRQKNPVGYKCGEKIELTVKLNEYLREHVRPVNGQKVRWRITGDDGQKSEGTDTVPFSLETSLAKPGFLRLSLTALLDDGSPDPAIGEDCFGFGAEIEKLSFHGTLPADFDEYWGKLEAAVASHEVRVLKMDPVYESVPEGYECFDVRLSCPMGRPASGFLTLPKGESKLRAAVVFTSYGLSGASKIFRPDSLVLWLNAHGIENDLPKDKLAEKYPELAGTYGFSREENERPETTYWQNMLLRDLIGTKWLKTHPRWNGKNLSAEGGSQGAFQAVSVAAHDPAVDFLILFVPAFCDLHAGEQGFFPGWHPEPSKGMEYFDTVAQAIHVACPVSLTANLADNICPPNGTVALYNAFRGDKKLTLLAVGQHTRFFPEPEQEAYFEHRDAKGTLLTVSPGTYRHYKGHVYRVLAVGKHTETLREMVTYQDALGNTWVRPASMWHDLVYYEGAYVRRFERMNEQ